jgi:hypothetical protein
VLDIDGDPGKNVFDSTRRRFSSGLQSKIENTRMTKTGGNGLHVYWLSTREVTPIRTADCMPGWEMEVKSDSSGGLATLPPSRHRNDPTFAYENIGQHYIGISDEFYPVVLDKMKDKLFEKTVDSCWRG